MKTTRPIDTALSPVTAGSPRPKNSHTSDPGTRCKLLSALSLFLLLSSCESQYYVLTDVHKDLSLNRSIYSDTAQYKSFEKPIGETETFSSSPEATNGRRHANPTPDLFFSDPDSARFTLLPQSLSIDFHNGTSEMNACLSSRFANIRQAGLQSTYPNQRKNPLFSPQESLQKKFRWFYTYYEYRAEFQPFEDLPVPLSQFLSPEQQALFFGEARTPQGWNGREMYEYLDELNRQFVKWYHKSTFEISYTAIFALAEPEFRSRMQEGKTEFFDKFEPNEPGDMEDLADFCEKLDEFLHTAYFSNLYTARKQEADSLSESQSRLLSYFNYAFVYRTNLPGKLVSSNAQRLQEGAPVWKIDGYRLLGEAADMQAVSRTVNVWAFILTFLASTAILYLLFRRKRK